MVYAFFHWYFVNRWWQAVDVPQYGRWCRWQQPAIKCQWLRRLIYRRSTITSINLSPVSFYDGEQSSLQYFCVLEKFKIWKYNYPRTEEKYSLKIWWYCPFKTCFMRRSCSWIHIWRSSPLTKWFKKFEPAPRFNIISSKWEFEQIIMDVTVSFFMHIHMSQRDGSLRT